MVSIKVGKISFFMSFEFKIFYLINKEELVVWVKNKFNVDLYFKI